jgi:hypothetical protein
VYQLYSIRLPPFASRQKRASPFIPSKRASSFIPSKRAFSFIPHDPSHDLGRSLYPAGVFSPIYPSPLS